MSNRARRTWRIAAVLVIAGIPLISSLCDLAQPFIPYGVFGFDTRGDGTITSISPASAAEEAGLKVGDRFDMPALSPQERAYIHWPFTLEHVKATFTFIKGPARLVTLVARGRSPNVSVIVAYFAVLYLFSLCVIAIVLTATTLVLAHPSRMTWAFLIYAAGFEPGSSMLVALMSPAWVVAYSIYCGVSWFAAPIALIVFTLRFPTDRVRGAGAIADRWLPWLAVAIAPFFVAVNIGRVFSGVDTDRYENLMTIVVMGLYTLAIIVFATRYLTEGRDERPRMAWVIASLLVAYTGTIAVRIFDWLDISVPHSLNLLLALNILVPIAVAYAIFKQRVISVRFFLNKALIIAVVVAIMIAAIALLDWIVAGIRGRLFSSGGTPLLIGVDLLAATILVFLAPALYRAIRNFIDRCFFWEEYHARQQMLQLATKLAGASSAGTIDDALVRSVADGLGIGSVAVFICDDDGKFRRERSHGWQENHVLDSVDAERLVVKFKKAQGAVRFSNVHSVGRHLPTGDSAPAMGLPIFVGRKLSRFVLFSGHPHGLDLDPSETRLLGEVTRAASHGFARLSQL